MSELKKGVILNYVNLAIGSLIPLLYTPIMLRLMGQDEYGLYKLSSSLTGYLGLLSMGIGASILRNLIKARTEGGKAEEQRVFSLFLVVYKCIAALILIVGAILVYNLDAWFSDSLKTENLKTMRILVSIMTCQSAMSFILGPYYSLITAHEKYILTQSIGIFLTILGPLSNLLALYFGYASIGIALSSFIVSICGQIIYMSYVRYKLKINSRYKNLPWNLLHEIFIFSFWVLIGHLSSVLYGTTDSLMIGANNNMGTVAVAVYSIGCTFSSILFNLTSGITSILAPRVNHLYFEGASNKELTEFGIKVARIQMYFIALILSGFICFGKVFIAFYAGEGYQEAYWVAIFTMIPYAITLVLNVYMNVSMAQFRHQFRAIISLAIAILNVLGTFMILPYYGIIGAAFITCLAGVLGQGVIMSVYYSKIIGIEMQLFWKSLIKVIYVPLLLTIITTTININTEFSIVSLIIKISIYTSIYLIFQYYCVTNKYEKELLTQFLNKIR